MLLFDARYLRQPRSGIPRYTLNLLRAVRAADPGRPVRVLIPHADALPEDLAHHPPFDAVVDAHAPRDPRDLFRWKRRIKELAPSVIHCPDAYAPLRSTVPTVITIHDLIPLLCRQGLTRSRKQRLLPLWKAWMKRQAHAARAVVTVSQHSAGDLNKHLNIPTKKIHVIHNAVPAPVAPATHQTPQDILAQLPAKAPYILCVSRLDPYKNVPGLIDAYAQLIQRWKSPQQPPQNQPPHLIVVGPHDPRYPQAHQQTRHHQLTDTVHFTGPITDDQLDTLYRHAALLVMPSTYEGFGLPAVEAMNHRVPVVAADRAALPEVVGDAALLVDPTDTEALTSAMHRVLTDATLAQNLIAKGTQRAQAFTLERIGEQYLQFVDRLR